MLADISKQQKGLIMIGVLLAIFVAALDSTIVGTAMPTIVKELGGLNHLSWVFTAYMLASTVTVPIYGKLSDIYGRKWFFFAGIVIFMLGSVLSGLSQDMMQLIVFRSLQGIGGGAIMANAFAIVGDLFTPRERGKWQGVLGGTFGLASIVGPILGGFITDTISWRWNFYINIPVGILALLAIGFLIPKIIPSIKERSIDYFGALTLALGLVTLLLGLVWGGTEYPWNSVQIIGLLIFAVIFLVIFCFIEQRTKEPIIPLSLFKNSIFSVSIFASFLFGVGMFGAALYIPLFAQNALGISAVSSGSLMTPMVIAQVITGIIGGRIVSSTGRYKMVTIAGLVVATIGMVLLSQMNTQTSELSLTLRMIFLGFGMGAAMPVFTVIVQNAFEHSKLGVVTSSIQLFRSIGGTVGIALLGSLLNSGLSKNLSVLPKNIAFANSLSPVFLAAAILLSIASFSTLFLKEIPLRTSHKEEPLLDKVGQELDTELAQAQAKDQPDIID
ncbi:MAG: MDR family MFS transporter [Candidatus Daviesbacteria bacterium]|nr:MDR family MFS transporter [Candidatus Daviesbacteria bacterium]